jgi:hypothetical protein
VTTPRHSGRSRDRPRTPEYLIYPVIRGRAAPGFGRNALGYSQDGRGAVRRLSRTRRGWMMERAFCFAPSTRHIGDTQGTGGAAPLGLPLCPAKPNAGSERGHHSRRGRRSRDYASSTMVSHGDVRGGMFCSEIVSMVN